MAQLFSSCVLVVYCPTWCTSPTAGFDCESWGEHLIMFSSHKVCRLTPLQHLHAISYVISVWNNATITTLWLKVSRTEKNSSLYKKWFQISFFSLRGIIVLFQFGIQSALWKWNHFEIWSCGKLALRSSCALTTWCSYTDINFLTSGAKYLTWVASVLGQMSTPVEHCQQVWNC